MSEELRHVLQHQIRSTEEGYLTFAAYMEQCLYHPEYGYYTKPGIKIGKRGDFYTSSSMHSVFAETIVDVVVEASQRMDRPVYFLEFGAGTGQFALQFLADLQQRYAYLYQDCHYLILEKSPEHIKQQKDKLLQHETRVEWLTTLDECAGFQGVMFANELFDAFPTHIVEMREDHVLQEIGVTWSVELDRFIEIRIPPTESVLEYIKKNNIRLQEAQRLEIPCAASTWMADIARITEGLWLVIDYGYKTEELSLPYLRDGSLLCYYQHQVDDNPLEKPGLKDLTYHIQFDALTLEAGLGGWEKLGLFAQHEFMLQAGIVAKLSNHQGGDPFAQEEMKRNRAIRHFISPEGISGAFRVLVLGKGVGNQQTYSFLQPFTFQTFTSLNT